MIIIKSCGVFFRRSRASKSYIWRICHRSTKSATLRSPITVTLFHRARRIQTQFSSSMM